MSSLTIILDSIACYSLFSIHYRRSAYFYIQRVVLSEDRFCMSHGYPEPGPFSLILRLLRRSLQRVLFRVGVYLLRFLYIMETYLWGLYILYIWLITCIWLLRIAHFVYLDTSHVYDRCTLIYTIQLLWSESWFLICSSVIGSVIILLSCRQSKLKVLFF